MNPYSYSLLTCLLLAAVLFAACFLTNGEDKLFLHNPSNDYVNDNDNDNGNGNSDGPLFQNETTTTDPSFNSPLGEALNKSVTAGPGKLEQPISANEVQTGGDHVVRELVANAGASQLIFAQVPKTGTTTLSHLFRECARDNHWQSNTDPSFRFMKTLRQEVRTTD